ncbi:kinase-like domain-containing protein [Rhizophagus irregularis DAOM 181602=DAOM 197198]|nr:kinase-like domain-containing protein [Rhizophagus irregularis DAOM 181602=DAOM 197198]GET49805.1 kinase-like domain-containing protein [Rhizophagus irregularis DAOM 181602=DAOM 197198]
MYKYFSTLHFTGAKWILTIAPGGFTISPSNNPDLYVTYKGNGNLLTLEGNISQLNQEWIFVPSKTNEHAIQLKNKCFLLIMVNVPPKNNEKSVAVDNNSCTLRSHSKLLSNQAPDQQSSSDYSQTYYTSVGQHNNYSFADFKFQSILGEGRSGKILLCEFRGNTIALKSANLSKTPLDIVEEMKKEVEIYKILADIQGKYIPKLICYDYYGVV